jgi:hypothetical protein
MRGKRHCNVQFTAQGRQLLWEEDKSWEEEEEEQTLGEGIVPIRYCNGPLLVQVVDSIEEGTVDAGHNNKRGEEGDGGERSEEGGENMVGEESKTERVEGGVASATEGESRGKGSGSTGSDGKGSSSIGSDGRSGSGERDSDIFGTGGSFSAKLSSSDARKLDQPRCSNSNADSLASIRNDPATPEPFEVLATFHTEVNCHGAVPGTMIGTMNRRCY